MGRSGQGDRGDEARQARDRDRHHQFRTRTYRGLQDAEIGGLFGCAAAQSVGQDFAAEFARSVLGGQRSAGELSASRHTHYVVPAKAGTHTPYRQWLREVLVASALFVCPKPLPVVMGPGVRPWALT